MRASVFSVLAASFIAASAYAQSTAFTYQGRLKSGSAAASGVHDFRFRLFDAATGGTQFGTTQCADNVSVSDGLFTTSIDFGQQFASPSPRFLEIEVRADTGLGCGSGTGFVLLGPRQLLTAAPIAGHAKSAFTLAAADGSPAAAVFVDNDGDVGIGTTTPAVPLHIARDLDPVLVIQDTGPTGTQAGYVGFWNSAPAETGWMGFGSPTNPDFGIQNKRAGGHVYILPGPGGNVGIGTTAPTARLDVRGGPMLVENTGDQADLLWLANERSWVFRQEGTGATTALKLQSVGGGGNKNFIVQTDGFVGIGTTSPAAKLHVVGTTRTTVLEITGADLAEKFPASEPLEPGMVVAIDREHAGKLCLSRSAYNRAVAGVVSGANDFAAGAILGNLPGHDDAPAVALTGRVYVWCDAGDQPIEPGDLLTTSGTPGHAMKAVDYARAQGAIIGKAMTELKDGKGMVLVLVNLQ